MKRTAVARRVALAAAVAGAGACAAAQPAAALGAAHPAVFRVGAAVRKITPTVPVFSGGFGLSPPITKLHDPLTVRAFYVASQGHAVAFATVDAQGYFASYQESPTLGITDERAAAARQIGQLNGRPKMSQADVIVQATHTHAGPTLEGIWGPSPRVYLQLVHDRVVQALIAAARSARPAYLQAATYDANRLDTHVIDTDSYPGWANDGQLSVLRGVDPHTRATIATFASVSVHGAHVKGDSERFLSADYFGRTSRSLQHKLGGVAVVGPATLGRQESPVEVTDVPTMQWFARIVENYIERALGAAHFVTDPTVRSAETFVQIPATNAALLALNRAWGSLSDAQKEQEAQASGIYPIDRDISPPYAEGNVIGTWLTSVRIGGSLYLSMPGEPFPEVSHSLRLHIQGARSVTLLSKGQDDLGYFYPSWVYPFTAAYGSDHHLFNIAPQAGDQFVEGQLGLAPKVGFSATPYIPPERKATEVGRDTQPGLEALAAPYAFDAGRDGKARLVFEAIYSPPKASSSRPQGDRVHWSFGDGTSAATGFLDTGQDYGQGGLGPVGRVRTRHLLRVGRYEVAVSAVNSDGQPASWQLPVRVFRRLRVHIVARRLHGSVYRLSTTFRGGAPPALAWFWRFGDGRRFAGRSVTRRLPGSRARQVSVVLVDSTGSLGRASLRIAPPPPSHPHHGGGSDEDSP
ncbi:MAG: hypothetical protein JOZ25_00745 [Actinobacteria bacterium]|nr:hypothetical protein [Actinomycetota bacterium]